MTEIYREQSSTNGVRKVIAGLALLAILALYVNEFNRYSKTGNFDPLGWGMDTVLLGLWFWRIGFSYELILYKERVMRVQRLFFGMVCGSKEYDLNRTETFSNKYEKKFFSKTGIKEYDHLYSSLDENTQHLLVYTKGEKKKLCGVLFKSSDKFVHQMRKLFPAHHIEL